MNLQLESWIDASFLYLFSSIYGARVSYEFLSQKSLKAVENVDNIF